MKLSEMGENAPRFRKAVPKEKEKEEEDQGPKDSRKIHVNGFPLTLLAAQPDCRYFLTAISLLIFCLWN